MTETIVTAEAQRRRRALGQILLLASGDFWCWSRSASTSVVLVNKARNDSALVVHTVEVENHINALLLEIRRAESNARGYLLTSGPEFLRDHETAVGEHPAPADQLTQLDQRQCRPGRELRRSCGRRSKFG